MWVAWVPVWVAALGQGWKLERRRGGLMRKQDLGSALALLSEWQLGQPVEQVAAPLVQATAVVSGLDSALGSARVKAW